MSIRSNPVLYKIHTSNKVVFCFCSKYKNLIRWNPVIIPSFPDKIHYVETCKSTPVDKSQFFPIGLAHWPGAEIEHFGENTSFTISIFLIL